MRKAGDSQDFTNHDKTQEDHLVITLMVTMTSKTMMIMIMMTTMLMMMMMTIEASQFITFISLSVSIVSSSVHLKD